MIDLLAERYKWSYMDILNCDALVSLKLINKIKTRKTEELVEKILLLSTTNMESKDREELLRKIDAKSFLTESDKLFAKQGKDTDLDYLRKLKEQQDLKMKKRGGK